KNNNISVGRRELLAGVAGAMAPAAYARAARWPERSIRVVVPYAPGGSTDAAARFIAAPMSKALGQTVVIENRTGATGTIGAAEVARAAPDGYTALIDAAAFASNPALFTNLSFDYVRAFIPV